MTKKRQYRKSEAKSFLEATAPQEIDVLPEETPPAVLPEEKPAEKVLDVPGKYRKFQNERK